MHRSWLALELATTAAAHPTSGKFAGPAEEEEEVIGRLEPVDARASNAPLSLSNRLTKRLVRHSLSRLTLPPPPPPPPMGIVNVRTGFEARGRARPGRRPWVRVGQGTVFAPLYPDSLPGAASRF